MIHNCHPRLSENAKRLSEGKGTQVVPHSRSGRMSAAVRFSTPHKLRDLGPLPLALALPRDGSAGDDTFFVIGGH